VARSPDGRPARAVTGGDLATRGAPYADGVLHYLLTGLLIAVAVLIACGCGYVVYRMYEGQR
jgi:hypothetical protein